MSDLLVTAARFKRPMRRAAQCRQLLRRSLLILGTSGSCLAGPIRCEMRGSRCQTSAGLVQAMDRAGRVVGLPRFSDDPLGLGGMDGGGSLFGRRGSDRSLSSQFRVLVRRFD